jgi:hypothetical protein
MPFSKNRDQWIQTKALDTHKGESYPITLLDPNGQTTKLEVKCYGNIVGAYREHPEAKFIAHDGSPCDRLTRGLLTRSLVIANRHRYIGKETSRHWEQGDDPSLVDFTCFEYCHGKAIADDEIKAKINEIGIRKLARHTGINRETVAMIAKGMPVKPITLAKVLQFLSTC